ncbi:MAG: uroporphyrinogen decarboxylase family protein [Finegoldia sp.]|nr:uroporphyrinogen decarboxylase family protein [Finegoldia sp.]
MEKLKIRDYPCPKIEEFDLSAIMEKDPDLAFPKAYREAESMARLSKIRKEATGSHYARLPFSTCLESEAMGGKVNYSDQKHGVRAGDPIVEKIGDILDLPDLDFTKGTLKEALDAGRILKEDSQRLIYDISGPITILIGLIDSKEIFVAMRKDKETLGKVYDKLKRNLLSYIEELLNIGVDVISFADPATGVNILGEKMFIAYIDNFLVDFLPDAQKIIADRAVFHLCPKLSYGLIDSKRADFVPIDVDKNLTYGHALLSDEVKGKIVGQACLKDEGHHIKGKIKTIKLKNN